MNSIDLYKARRIRKTKASFVKIQDKLLANQRSAGHNSEEPYILLINNIFDMADKKQKVILGKALYKLFAYFKFPGLRKYVKEKFQLNTLAKFKLKYVEIKPVLELTESHFDAKLDVDNLEVNESGNFICSVDNFIYDKDIRTVKRTNYKPLKSIDSLKNNEANNYFEWKLSDINVT